MANRREQMLGVAVTYGSPAYTCRYAAVMEEQHECYSEF